MSNHTHTYTQYSLRDKRYPEIVSWKTADDVIAIHGRYYEMTDLDRIHKAIAHENKEGQQMELVARTVTVTKPVVVPQPVDPLPTAPGSLITATVQPNAERALLMRKREPGSPWLDTTGLFAYEDQDLDNVDIIFDAKDVKLS